MVNILYSWQAFLRDVLQGGNGGEDPDPPIPPLTRNSKFFFHYFYICSLSRKNIFSTIFQNDLNMCFVHTIPMELEFTIYYLSRDAFSYVVSTIFACRV